MILSGIPFLRYCSGLEMRSNTVELFEFILVIGFSNTYIARAYQKINSRSD